MMGMPVFTYLLGFRGDIVPYFLEFGFCRHRVFLKVVDRKKIARVAQACQKAIPLIKYPMKSYRAVNVVGEATINFPDFALGVVDSASPKGAFCGSSSGT
jgi:hypothetical protein